MKEIFKCLRKYTIQIIIIILLLVMQARCDLLLPEYTSRIINTGIASFGIETVTPMALRDSEMKKIVSFMKAEDASKLLTYYDYIEKDNKDYINKYKILSEEGVYVLKDNKENLEDLITIPMALVYSKNLNIEFNGVTDFKDKFETNETFIKSALVSYIRSEYIIIGLDVDKIQMDYIYKTGLKMLLLSLTIMTITIITVLMSSKVSSGFATLLREKLATKVMDYEPQDLNKFQIASLITRCTNDIVQVQGLIGVVLRIVIYAPIIGIGAIHKVKNSPINYVIILAVSLIFALMLILLIVVLPKFKKFQDLLDRLNLVSKEQLNGLSVIRAFANEKEEKTKFDKANSDLTNNGIFVGTAMSLLIPTLTFIMNSTSILIVWLGGKYVDTFDMQVGDLIAFMSYTMQIIMAFLMISMIAIMLPRAIVSMRRISEVFNTKKSIISNSNKKIKKDSLIIEFKDVYFRYPGANEDVLRNISFTAKQGETVAFIGSTGSGKSTLINLIPRLYDVTNGKILINGLDIKDVDLKDLRSLIGYVPQKGRLFKGTILSNIEFGQKEKNLSKVNDALDIAQAREFVEEDPSKLNRSISEGGTNVSGGQRQRLSIARALAKDASIYIFDDSFSALDFKTESLLRKELKKATKDKIVFIVGQRISSIMHADKIVVLNEGEVVGIGDHETLLKTCPIYKEIKDSQLGGDK